MIHLQQTRSPWTISNIITAIFLFLIIVFLLSFSIYQQAFGKAVEVSVEDDASKEKLSALELREAKLDEQSKILLERENKLKEQEDLLNKQGESLQDLVDIRTNIIKELVDKFSQSNLVLDIDNQTGAIRFSDGIFFDSNRDVIKENGGEYLKEFIPIYISILLSEANRDYIAEIIIEGHTDEVGSYIYNLDLSQKRAFAVTRYILEKDIPNFTYQDIVYKYLTANGRSYSQPIYNGDIIDKEKSRRVEFKFRLKDEDTIKEMQQLFEGANQ